MQLLEEKPIILKNIQQTFHNYSDAQQQINEFHNKTNQIYKSQSQLH